ncbi:MAG: C39 family peptidase [Ardenticatenales bacterium]|nr:C39 family peptidase [Ardenticatenales bacterium]
MSQKTKRIIILLALAQAVLGLGLLALPRVVQALPGSLTVRLQARAPILRPVFDLVTTPLPASLPVPSGALAQKGQVGLPTLDFANPTATTPPTPPTPTAAPVTPEPTAATADVNTPAPTTIPTPAPTATPTPIAIPTETVVLAAQPPAKALEGLKNRPQNFNNCGPANLSMVLNFWGDPTTQTEAAAYLKPNPEDRNVSPWQMADYVNEQTGLRSSAHSSGTIDLIRTFIANGIPVIIEKGYEPNEREGWYGHYLTVYGYDEEARTLRSQDTYLGPWDDSGREDTYDEINAAWEEFNYSFFVIYQPYQENLVQAILGDLNDPIKMWQNAALRAQAAIEANQTDAFAWFNLGTSLTRLGEQTGTRDYYEQGAAAFDQSFILGIPPRMLWYEFRPYIAYMKVGRYQDMLTMADTTLETTGGRNVEETYLYKGHALAFLGDISGARAAYQQGLKLNENSYPIQWALDSLP